MGNSEVLMVVLVGLCLGYMAVSMLLGGSRKKPKAGKAPDAPAAAPARDARDTSTGPHETPTATPRAPAWDHVLGVSRMATEEEIRTAYRSLMSQYHPDKVAALGQELRDLAERKSREIGAAYSAALRERGLPG